MKFIDVDSQFNVCVVEPNSIVYCEVNDLRNKLGFTDPEDLLLKIFGMFWYLRKEIVEEAYRMQDEINKLPHPACTKQYRIECTRAKLLHYAQGCLLLRQCNNVN
jgi:hypothetical protein